MTTDHQPLVVDLASVDQPSPTHRRERKVVRVDKKTHGGCDVHHVRTDAPWKDRVFIETLELKNEDSWTAFIDALLSVHFHVAAYFAIGYFGCVVDHAVEFGGLSEVEIGRLAGVLDEHCSVCDVDVWDGTDEYKFLKPAGVSTTPEPAAGGTTLP